MAQHNDFGTLAEDLAADYLQKQGYSILARNYRFRKAEVDLIARLGQTLVIAEVKARTSDTVAAPQEAINKKKIALLISAADAFLQDFPEEMEVRFDVLSLLPDYRGVLQITHIEHAFESIDGI